MAHDDVPGLLVDVVGVVTLTNLPKCCCERSTAQGFSGEAGVVGGSCVCVILTNVGTLVGVHGFSILHPVTHADCSIKGAE